MHGSLAPILRAWGLALLALAIWLFAHAELQPHRVADANAPVQSFSGRRAEAVLARILGPERPHPVGSAENAAVRARIIGEFAKLGIRADTYRAFTCESGRRFVYVACATVTDVVADVIPGEGKAVVLLAHYDSVPAGPGASDDESGVATVLETARALRARGGKSLHPILAVLTDGEEAGLLGANAFLQNAALEARVGAVVNVEARGTRGESLLFQTSPGDGRLVDLYAASVPVYATSSLYAEIYKFLPNDTDLTLFIRDGFPSFNFAFADNVRYYHSPFDIRANLDPATLQMHGENLLGVSSALEKTPFAALKGGDEIYLSLYGIFLPRLPQSWALPLAVLAFLALTIAAWLARSDTPLGWRSVLSATAMPLVALILSGLFGWLVSFIAQLVSARSDPSYAYPIALRFALGFAVWTVALLAARMAKPGAAVTSVWLWMAGLGVVTAALVPGFSPYFLFPALVAAVLLLAASLTPGKWSGRWGEAAILLSALAALLIWLPLVASGETLMGLRLHPLFTLPAALGLLTVVPLLATQPMTRGGRNASAGVSALAAIAAAVIAGFLPAYSALSPQRVNIIYLENGKAPARWIADTSWKGIGTEPIPGQLMKAGPFQLNADAWAGLMPGSGYTAPAGAPRDPLPTATILRDVQTGGRRILDLVLRGSPGANSMIVSIPKAAKLVALDLRGQHLAPQGAGDVRLICWTPDCRTLPMTLALAGKGPLVLSFAEIRHGLPEAGGRLVAARPATAMASQSGDETVLADKLSLPPR